MAKTFYNVTGYYKRGALVYEVPTGTKPKKTVPYERRKHRKFRGNWDLTALYREHQR